MNLCVNKKLKDQYVSELLVSPILTNGHKRDFGKVYGGEKLVKIVLMPN